MNNLSSPCLRASVAKSPRKVADELRVIRKALRRIEAHPPSETLPALERVRQMVAEATSKRRTQ